jgi:predicted permease
MQNLRLAFRTLLKTPFVTSIAVLSLALGIGANAAIFSLLEQVLLRPLPVHEPDRLVNLTAPGPKPGSTSCNQAGDCTTVFSYPMFRDLQHGETGLAGVAAHFGFGANLAQDGRTLDGRGMLVSGSYFPLLGIQPALGRLIGPSDDQTIGGHFVAVLSHNYWQNQLGADPSVIDQTIVVNGHPMTIVGVAPDGFEGTTFGTRPDVFVPITMRGYMSPGFNAFDNRRSYWVYVFGRLGPGVSIEQVETSINVLYAGILNEVEAPLQQEMSAQTMAQFRAKTIGVIDGRRGQSSVHDDGRVPLLLLFGIAGIVLLIACANIANLLLARGANRSLEMAVRLSLGATRLRVLSQLFTESLLLAAMGGAASLLVALWTLSLIASLLPVEAVATFDYGINFEMLLYAAVLSIGAGILFGIFPALHNTRSELVTTIRSNSGQIAGARSASRLRSSLVTAQIALSMTLLISAGLFLRSLVNLNQTDLGIDVDNVLTFSLSPALSGYENERSLTLYDRLGEELAALPGVTAVSSATLAILDGSSRGSDVSVEGFQKDPDTDANSNANTVGPGYFTTLGIPLLAGREFTRFDREGAAMVAIVNEAFAEKFNLGTDAVGKRMALGNDELEIEIVGLARNAKYAEVRDEVPPVFFRPYMQQTGAGFMTYYVRTASDPGQLLQSIYAVVGRLDPNLPVVGLKTMPQQVRENLFLDRIIGTLSAAFAGLATVLAAIGLYGVLAYTVSQRTREIGVRMALGADAGRVRKLILRQVGRMMVIGVLIGVVAAVALGRAASSLLFGLAPHDPLVVGLSIFLLTGVAIGAAYVPALRASRVNPVEALRYG